MSSSSSARCSMRSRLRSRSPFRTSSVLGRISDADGVRWNYLITGYCAARPFSELAS